MFLWLTIKQQNQYRFKIIYYLELIIMNAKKIFLSAVVLFSVITASYSQTATSKAKAEIVAAMTIIDDSGDPDGTALDFGVLTISPTEAGTCILSTANRRIGNNGVTVVNSSTSTTASFGVSGKSGLSYNITLPVAPVTITRNGGTETMTISDFTALPASSITGDAMTGTLDGAGKDSFKIGGTLYVNAAQAEGVYESTFTVSVAYN